MGGLLWIRQKPSSDLKSSFKTVHIARYIVNVYYLVTLALAHAVFSLFIHEWTCNKEIIFNEASVSSCLRRGNKPISLVAATGLEPRTT